MRISRTTLALIVLNAASLAALGWLVLRGKVQSAAPQVQYVTNYVPILKARSQPLITNVVVAGTNDFRWEQLESEDYRAYIARLRAIGCPEQTIRDIIIADVDKMLSPQMLQASGRTNPIQYWQPIEQELWETAEQR
jgi:hypothetical protein